MHLYQNSCAVRTRTAFVVDSTVPRAQPYRRTPVISIRRSWSSTCFITTCWWLLAVFAATTASDEAPPTTPFTASVAVAECSCFPAPALSPAPLLLPLLPGRVFRMARKAGRVRDKVRIVGEVRSPHVVGSLRFQTTTTRCWMGLTRWGPRSSFTRKRSDSFF